MASTKKHKREKVSVVLPGDVVELPEDDDKSKKLRLGPGLRQGLANTEDEHVDVVAAKCGVLRSKSAAFWLESNQKRVRSNAL